MKLYSQTRTLICLLSLITTTALAQQAQADQDVINNSIFEELKILRLIEGGCDYLDSDRIIVINESPKSIELWVAHSSDNGESLYIGNAGPSFEFSKTPSRKCETYVERDYFPIAVRHRECTIFSVQDKIFTNEHLRSEPAIISARLNPLKLIKSYELKFVKEGIRDIVHLRSVYPDAHLDCKFEVSNQKPRKIESRLQRKPNVK